MAHGYNKSDAKGGERKGIRARNYFFFSIHNRIIHRDEEIFVNV